MKKSSPLLLGSFAVCLLAAAAAADAAEAFPARPLRFVVPFPPGGGTDILARLIGTRLSERLGFQVVVDNRPGAGTNIGMEIVARAVPDGHTVLMASVGLAANPSLYANMRFDPLRDLAPVTMVALAPTILVAHPPVGARTPKDLIALARAQPGKLNYGSFGTGSGSHLAAELFKATTGTHITHIPYKGGGPAITALLAGEVQLVFSSLLPTLAHIKAGRIMPIALAAGRRSQVLPAVPTFREAGVAYETGTWFGVLVPAKAAIPVVRRLHNEIAAIVRSDEVSNRIAAEGAEPIGGTPEAFGDFIATEAKRWAAVLKDAAIRVE
jgi:tripartite-type tricarboxylate transporter receptor subunit TctC